MVKGSKILTVMWYVVLQGRQQGPFTWEQILHLVDSGALQPEDLAWHAGLSGWIRADLVPGLLSGRPPYPPNYGDEPQHYPGEPQKHDIGLKDYILKILGFIRIRPVFRINWLGLAFALVIILVALGFKLFGN